MDNNDRNRSGNGRPTGQRPNNARPTGQRPTNSRPTGQRPTNSKPSANVSNSNKKNKKKKSGKSSVLKIMLVMFLIACFAIAGAGIGAYFGIISSAEKLNAVSVTPSIFSSKIIVEATNEEYAVLEAKENREYVTIDTLPDYLPHAFVAIEDSRFYTHNGIDFKGMARSAVSTFSGKGRQGGSTITQQLIKNIRGISNNNIKQKLQEQYLAVQYEKDMEEVYGSKQAAKDKILEIYMNTINLGGDYNGVQTAAQHYFNKDASELNIAESAVLAGITQYPSKYNPLINPEDNRDRQLVVLKYMLDQGYITNDEYTEAVDDDVYARIADYNISTTSTGGKNTYYTDQVIIDVTNDLAEKYNISVAEASNMVYNSGLEIMIPIDLEIQSIVDEAFLDDSNFPSSGYKIQVIYLLDIKNEVTGKTSHFEEISYVKSKDEIDGVVEKFKNETIGENDTILAEATYPVVQPQSSFVVIDNETGYVMAIEGGRGEKLTNLGLNRASASKRQPGSTFKMVAAFAPGIDAKTFTAGTVFDDVPFKVGTHNFRNWYSGYRGLSTVREGVRDSMNIVAVKAMDAVGIEKSFDYLLNFGFTTLVDTRTQSNGDVVSDKGLTTALGGLTDGVTNLELTAAYATIANGGEYRKPVFYTKVYDHDGNVILDNTERETRTVIREVPAYIITDTMVEAVQSGTGTGAKFKNLSMPIAGKTGTTSDSYDLWFEGYTPYYTAGIWLGYDEPETIRDSNYHKALWSKIMEKIHVTKGLESKPFEKPEGIDSVSICRESGQLPGQYCSLDPRGNTIYTELFESGTAPTTTCSVHKGVSVDTSTGLIATDSCPADLVATRGYIVRPSGINQGSDVKDSIYQFTSLGTCTAHNGNATEDESVEGEDYYIDPITGEHLYINNVDGTDTGDNVDSNGNTSPSQSRAPNQTGSPLPTSGSQNTQTSKPAQTPVPTPTEPPLVVIPEFSENN